MDNIIEKKQVLDGYDKLFKQSRYETDEQFFERVMNKPFDPNRYEIIPNNDASDYGDDVESSYSIVEKKHFKENSIGELFSDTNETKEQLFEKKMGFAFDPNKYKIVEKEDANGMFDDGPISTWEIKEIIPVDNIEEPNPSLVSNTPEQHSSETPNPSLVSNIPEQPSLETPNPSLVSNTPEQPKPEKKKSNELYDEFDEFEKAFVDDVKAESLAPGDQEFDQMLNQRAGINKDKILEYFKTLNEEKELKHKQDLWDNLNEFEKAFVDDAKAESLAPGDPEFDQMLGQRTGIDRDKIIGYFEGRIVKKEPKVEEKKEETKEPEKDNKEEKIKNLKEKRGLLYRLKKKLGLDTESKKEREREKVIAENDISRRLGFTDIFVITSVTAIIGVLLIFIIKLIK